MQNASDFRRIVLGMRDAIEGAHMGHPDFRIRTGCRWRKTFERIESERLRGSAV